MTHGYDASTTLARIATDSPGAIRVFERLRLDYCCGGAERLDVACRRLGLDAERVLRQIGEAGGASTSDERDWSGATMTELADHIEATHHVYVREALDRLSETLPRIAGAHADAHPELNELVLIFGAFAGEMRDHMVREERVLFPWLRRLERPTEIQGGPPWSVRAPIDCMEHDHEAAGRALVRMRELTGGFEAPADACSMYRAALATLAELERDTHVHIHKENNILFPAGLVAEERRSAEMARMASASAHRRAFTLVELMVVVAIIGLLISVMLPAVSSARGSARAVQCLSNTRSIAVALTMYADDDHDRHFPTARMPSMPMNGQPAAPFQISWLYLIAPYIGVDERLPDDPTSEEIHEFVHRLGVCQCPEDHSAAWQSEQSPRLASYAINAYITPNHPPYWGVRPAQIRNASETIVAAELAEGLSMDHFMPMFWGDPPAVANPMTQARQWDAQAQRPKVLEHTRHHGDRANYVFADGHAGPHSFTDTWLQARGSKPARNWYDPRR